MAYVIVKYIHLLGIFILFASLVAEHILVKAEMSPTEIRRVSIIDLIFGISAGVVLIAGLALWFVVGKPAEFYSANPVFHVKVTLFVLVGLISIYPTRFFIFNRRSEQPLITVPKRIITTIRLELAILLLLPLLAVLMAQGYGLS